VVEPSIPTCPAHPGAAANATCRSCARGLCLECWRRDVDGSPWCEPCIELLERRTPSVLYLAGGALVLALFGLLVPTLALDTTVRWCVFGVGALVTGTTTARLYRSADRRRLAHEIRPREVRLDDATRGDAPYRGGPRLRRVARKLAPPISGALATLVVGSALALTAAIVPAVLHLPRWLEVEAVLVLWWAVWALVFTALLFRGRRIARDVGELREEPLPEVRERRWIDWLDWPDATIFDAGDPDGCLLVLGVMLASVVLYGAAWIAAELVVPILLLIIYTVLCHALASVANDRHRCEGNLVRASSWGATWAFLYTAPIAALVWLAHAALAALH
jgi:hypothetical protein